MVKPDTYTFHYGPEEKREMKLVTVAVTGKHVRDWVGRQKIYFRGARRNQIVGLSGYGRHSQAHAHTLAIAVKKKIMIIDLESVPNISSKLKRVLQRTENFVANVNQVNEELDFIRGHDIIVRRVDDSGPELVNHYIATVKDGGFSDDALLVAAIESNAVYVGAFSIRRRK